MTQGRRHLDLGPAWYWWRQSQRHNRPWPMRVSAGVVELIERGVRLAGAFDISQVGEAADPGPARSEPLWVATPKRTGSTAQRALAPKLRKVDHRGEAAACKICAQLDCSVVSSLCGVTSSVALYRERKSPASDCASGGHREEDEGHSKRDTSGPPTNSRLALLVYVHRPLLSTPNTGSVRRPDHHGGHWESKAARSPTPSSKVGRRRQICDLLQRDAGAPASAPACCCRALGKAPLDARAHATHSRGWVRRQNPRPELFFIR